jgi:RimK-like ATP-grasp domain
MESVVSDQDGGRPRRRRRLSDIREGLAAVARTLIVTNRSDATGAYLENALQRASIPCIKATVDENDPPFMEFEIGATPARATLDVSGEPISAADVKAIIFRRPSLPVFGEHDARERFLQRESIAGLRTFLESCDALWINHPLANSRAENKPRNLVHATSMGLHIPRTFVSSSPSSIAGWLQDSPNELVIKSVTHGLLQSKDSASMIFTQIVRSDFDPFTMLTPGVPVIIQQRIKKTHDARVTIVGNRVFAAATEATDDSIDWRSEPRKQHWVPIEIPSDVMHAVLTFCRNLGLNFAAIDFVISEDSEWFFLEINPNGQWVWIQQETGLPISDGFVELLT